MMQLVELQSEVTDELATAHSRAAELDLQLASLSRACLALIEELRSASLAPSCSSFEQIKEIRNDNTFEPGKLDENIGANSTLQKLIDALFSLRSCRVLLAEALGRNVDLLSQLKLAQNALTKVQLERDELRSAFAALQGRFAEELQWASAVAAKEVEIGDWKLREAKEKYERRIEDLEHKFSIEVKRLLSEVRMLHVERARDAARIAELDLLSLRYNAEVDRLLSEARMLHGERARDAARIEQLECSVRSYAEESERRLASIQEIRSSTTWKLAQFAIKVAVAFVRPVLHGARTAGSVLRRLAIRSKGIVSGPTPPASSVNEDV